MLKRCSLHRSAFMCLNVNLFDFEINCDWILQLRCFNICMTKSKNLLLLWKEPHPWNENFNWWVNTSNPETPRRSKSTLNWCPTLQCVTLVLTCTGAPVGQVRRDSDGPDLVYAHALQTFLHTRQQSTLSDQAHFGLSSLMAVGKTLKQSSKERKSKSGAQRNSKR